MLEVSCFDGDHCSPSLFVGEGHRLANRVRSAGMAEMVLRSPIVSSAYVLSSKPVVRSVSLSSLKVLPICLSPDACSFSTLISSFMLACFILAFTRGVSSRGLSRGDREGLMILSLRQYLTGDLDFVGLGVARIVELADGEPGVIEYAS